MFGDQNSDGKGKLNRGLKRFHTLGRFVVLINLGTPTIEKQTRSPTLGRTFYMRRGAATEDDPSLNPGIMHALIEWGGPPRL